MTIRLAERGDLELIARQDKWVSREILQQKIERGEVLAAFEDGFLIGWLRYGLFWDNTPFLTLLHVAESRRGQGVGRALTACWEEAMRRQGYPVVLTSTAQDETAQHFYTKLGYAAIGGFTPPGEPYELLFSKRL